jgi:regulator of nucleoside diphosphate kinase
MHASWRSVSGTRTPVSSSVIVEGNDMWKRMPAPADGGREPPGSRRPREDVLRVEGAFDLGAARRVLAVVAAERDLSITVDLERAREIHDDAVALLAAATEPSAGRVVVRGLREHHRRVLRYLGIGQVLERSRWSERIVVLTDQDVARLHAFVERHRAELDTACAAKVEARLANATVVPPGEVPREVVTMNSRVLFEEAGGGMREMVLVYSPAPDLSSGSLSVFTPIGAGVLGRTAGERIDSGPEITGAPPRIVSIPYQPEAAGHFDL